MLFAPSNARGGEVQGPVSQQASTTVPGTLSHTRRYLIIYMFVFTIVFVIISCLFFRGGGWLFREKMKILFVLNIIPQYEFLMNVVHL